MKQVWAEIIEILKPDFQRDRVVPATGFTASLTGFTSAAMAFLIVFAAALSLASDRLGDRWSSALAQTATIRISAPVDQVDYQVEQVMKVLQTTPGIASAVPLSEQEQQKLSEPWFGRDLPLANMPIPRLIDITEAESGFDAEGLRLRLAAEAPGAVLDDHMRWRKPLVRAANRLQWLGIISIVTITMTSAAMVILAARAALAANAQVITVLRLIGAQDNYIVAAFVRRFAARSFLGALVGGVFGGLAILILPNAQAKAAVLSGLSFQGIEWAILALIPPVLAIVAFFATRFAAKHVLEGLS